MSPSTLTIRLRSEQRAALKRSAKILGKSESEYVRDLLQRDLDTRLFGERMGELVGCLDSSQTTGRLHSLKEQIRERNWRK